MNIQQFQYILAVSEMRHFEQAADKCAISQSTLSTMIGRFEDEIGIKIFDRKTKPVSITRDGETLIRQLKIIMKDLNSLENMIQEMKGEMEGHLSIGVIPTVAPHLMPLFLSRFASRFPKVNIIVQEMITPEIQRSLKDGSLDIGIAAIPLEDPYLQEFPLYKEPFLLFDYYSNKISQKEINIEDIDYAHLLLLTEGHCLRNQVEQICGFSSRNERLSMNFEFKAGSIDSLIRFTKAYKGITLLPWLATAELDKEDRARLVAFASPVPIRSIGLVVHENFVKKRMLYELQSIIRAEVQPLINIQAEERLVKPF